MTESSDQNRETFKRAMRSQWDAAADGWNSHAPLIRQWLGQATQAMLTMAGIRAGMKVLDVAAGAGDQTLDIAERVGPGGSVLATDLSPAILAFARARAEQAGLNNVSTQVADGESLGVEEAAFDAAVCRLGLMFFPDPLQGLRQVHRALKPGASACTMVFSTPQANPCIGILISTACKHAGLPPPNPYQPGGLFSLGQPGSLDELFARAGFREIATTRLSAPFKLASAGQYLEFIRSSASPVIQILSRLSEAQRQDAWAEMEEKLKAFNTEAGWSGPNELLLTAGKR
jgi:ubiquinone/menaquinone biosynthesis C-methylase UbiE